MNRIKQITTQQSPITTTKLSPEQQKAFNELVKVKPGDKVFIVKDVLPPPRHYWETGQIVRAKLTKSFLASLPDGAYLIGSRCDAQHEPVTDLQVSGDRNKIWRRLKATGDAQLTCNVAYTREAYVCNAAQHREAIARAFGPANN